MERFDKAAQAICTSSVTLGELHYGIEKSTRPFENLKVLEQFASNLVVLPFSAEAAAHFGQIRAELERAGTPVGAYDLMIGAHARAEGLIVVTNNTREFARMPGVRVENWI
jgi:tRNA(fMet)-specific endonuclease VapC